MPLKGLLALISAYEWRKKGVQIPFLGARIHPHFGVFSPIRGEYLELVAKTPLPSGTQLAMDIGCGTGVLSAILAKRGVPKIMAIDLDDRALACARENIENLGFANQVEFVKADLFPKDQAISADLIVCNPPWIPALPTSPIESAVYDPDSRMLRALLGEVSNYLQPKGELWLIISDLAERLGLRSRDQLLAWIAQAGLLVLDRMDTAPKHQKTKDRNDPLYEVRSKEITSLWRLAKAKG